MIITVIDMVNRLEYKGEMARKGACTCTYGETVKIKVDHD